MKQALPFLLLGLLAVRSLAADAVPEAVAVPAPLSMAAINAPLVVARIKAGELTPEQAWQQGQLKEDDLLFLLEQEGGDRGSLNLVDSSGLNMALAELLVKHCPELVRKPETLNAGVRFRLADYYWKQRDSRAGGLFESLLDEAKAALHKSGTATNIPWYYPPVITMMGEYYQIEGEYQKAIDTLLGALAVTPHPGYAPDWLIQAASVYRLMGEPQKAQECYARLKQYSSGWFNGLARFNQARQLINQDRLIEARRLLQQPVTGDGSEKIRVALLSLLGDSYYIAGEFGLALQQYQQALVCFATLPQSQRSNDIKSLIGATQKRLQLIQYWPKEPLSCDPQKVVVTTSNQTGLLWHRLYVCSFQAVPLVVTSDNAQLSAQVKESGWPEDNVSKVDVEQEVLLKIAVTSPVKNFSAMLTIFSPKFPKFQLHIPVQVQKQ